MTAIGPTLETERLILRPPAAADFDAWAQMMTDVDACRFIGGAQPRPVAWRGMATMVGAWSLRGFSMWSVVEKANGRWIGRLGPWKPEGWPGTEVGWGLVRDAWGRGYATEGAEAAMDFAFETLGWSEAIHTIDVGNAPSKAVARRLGSSLLRMTGLPAPFEDVEVELWGQTREQWRARRSERQNAATGANSPSDTII